MQGTAADFGLSGINILGSRHSKLKEFTIINSQLHATNWNLPLFTNLSKLEFLHINRNQGAASLLDISEILLACPQIKHLGLSAAQIDGRIQTGFDDLCRSYMGERVRRNLAILRLKTLHLGLGFLPGLTRAEAVDLAAFTDLSLLETLRVDNLAHNNGLTTTHLLVSPTQFSGMQSLRSIQVPCLSPDVVSIIRMTREQQTAPNLCEITLTNYFQSVSRSDSHRVEANHDPSSIEIEQLEVYSWRSINIVPATVYDKLALPFLRNFIGRCVEVEELVIPVGVYSHHFHKIYMPKLPRLKTIIYNDWRTRVSDLPALALEVFKMNRAAHAIDPDHAQLQYFGFASPKVGRIAPYDHIQVFACLLLAPVDAPPEAHDFDVAVPGTDGEQRRYRVWKLSVEESWSFLPGFYKQRP